MINIKYIIIFIAWTIMSLFIIFGFAGCSRNQENITPKFLGETIIHSYEKGKEAGAEQMIEMYNQLMEQESKQENYEKRYD